MREETREIANWMEHWSLAVLSLQALSYGVQQQLSGILII